MGNAGLMAFYAGDFSRGQESSIFSVSALTPKDWSKLTRHAGGGSNAILDRIEESTFILSSNRHTGKCHVRYGTLLSFDILRVLEKANPANSEVGMADTGESVKRLKVEIDTLADEQAEALRSAT